VIGGEVSEIGGENEDVEENEDAEENESEEKADGAGNEQGGEYEVNEIENDSVNLRDVATENQVDIKYTSVKIWSRCAKFAY
jgi:hypothetical protein